MGVGELIKVDLHKMNVKFNGVLKCRYGVISHYTVCQKVTRQ